LKSNILKYRTSIKKNDLKKYFIYLEEFMPVYEKLIWNKNYNKLVDKKKQIIQLMKKYNYNELIKKVAIFYDVKDIALIDVAFYPIPYGDNIKAYRIKNLATIGVLMAKEQNLKWLLSATILHEISHTLYFNSKIIKDKRLLVIEAFATSIGAGWGYSKFTGKADTNLSWYNNKEYDDLAKKIYPKIDIYLDGAKKMDKEFIKLIIP